MADVAKLCEELLSLTILEAKELNDLLEEKGIKAAAAVAVAGPAGGRGSASPEGRPATRLRQMPEPGCQGRAAVPGVIRSADVTPARNVTLIPSRRPLRTLDRSRRSLSESMT